MPDPELQSLAAELTSENASLRSEVAALKARCERLQDYYECKMETPQRVSNLEREHKSEVARLREALEPVLRAAQDALDADTAYNRAQMTTAWASPERNKTAGNLMAAEHTLVLMAKGLPYLFAALSAPPAPSADTCSCPPPTFTIRSVTGPNGGTEICTRCGRSPRL